MAKKVKIPERHFDHATWTCEVQKGNVPKLTLDFTRDPMPSTDEPAKNHFLGSLVFFDNRHMVNDEKGNRFLSSSTHQNADLKIVIEGKYNVIRLAKWMKEHNATGANTQYLDRIPERFHDFKNFHASATTVPATPEVRTQPPAESQPTAMGNASVPIVPEPVAERLPIQEQLAFPANAPAISITEQAAPAVLNDGHQDKNASHVEKLAVARALSAAAQARQAGVREPEQLSLQGDPVFLRPSSFTKVHKPRKEREPKPRLHANSDTASGDLWVEKTTSPENEKGRSK